MALDPLNRHKALTFVQAAEDFCRLVEGRTVHSPAQFLAQVQVLLPTVYTGGAQLPLLEPGDTTEPQAKPSELKFALLRELADFLGPYDRYWEVYDPAKPDGDERMQVSLADDLSDIYFDLREGLELWRRGGETHERNAIFEWRLGWETHWGAHVVDALRAIHWHLESHWVDAEEPLKPVPPGPAA